MVFYKETCLAKGLKKVVPSPDPVGCGRFFVLFVGFTAETLVLFSTTISISPELADSEPVPEPMPDPSPDPDPVPAKKLFVTSA